MKIGTLEIPEDLEHLVEGRTEKDLSGLEAWVVKARASKLTHEEMRNTLVVSGWAAPFVDWYLLIPGDPGPVLPPVVKNPKTGAEMILIPEGEFIMGRKRRVFLDAYRIGRTPVTVGEFKTYCADKKIDFTKFLRPPWGWKDDHPMVSVTWRQARDFCVWAGGDLPTEAQWEKAARGTDGRKYPWGNEWDASRCRNNAQSTSAVGSYPSGASPFGCLDMSGNVWEWCLDRYGIIPPWHTAPNPTGPAVGIFRVLRGGSWISANPEIFLSAGRDFNDPALQIYGSGFRLAGPP